MKKVVKMEREVVEYFGLEGRVNFKVTKWVRVKFKNRKKVSVVVMCEKM